MSRIDSFMNLSPLKTTVSRKVISFSDISAVNFILVRKSKDRPQWTPNVVFVVASHYQSLQIVVLLLQACLFGSLALSRKLLLQQLQWLQQDRWFNFDSIRESLQLLFENKQCCKLLIEGKVEMFHQFRSR